MDTRWAGAWEDGGNTFHLVYEGSITCDIEIDQYATVDSSVGSFIFCDLAIVRNFSLEKHMYISVLSVRYFQQLELN